VAFQIDQEVRRIVDECYEKAKRILTENRDKLERVATALLEKESLESGELTFLLEAPAEGVPGDAGRLAA